MRGRYLILLLGLALLVLGGWLIAGSLGLVAPWPFSPPAPASDAAVVLAGAALLLGQLHDGRRGWVQVSLGVALLMLAGAGYIPAALGLDIAGMRLGQAVAVALLGLALISTHVARLHAALVQSLLLLLVLVATAGLAGHFLDIRALYPGYADVHITPPLAATLLALAAGLWLQSHEMEWRQRLREVREDRKIFLISGAIVLGIALSAGFAGAALMSDATQNVLSDSLMISLDNRIRNFRTEIEHAVENARIASTRPRLNNLLAKLREQGLDEEERKEAQKILDDIVKNTPIVALALYDSEGNLLGQRGKLVGREGFEAPLAAYENMTLLSHKGSMLRARMPMAPKGTRVGLLEVDIPLPEIDGLFRDFAGLGERGAMAVCAAERGDRLICMPARANNYRTIRPLRHIEGKPIPMSHALDGQAGFGRFVDAHSVDTLSAYGPIGKLGLGMVVKVHAAEIYQPVRQKLGSALAAIAGLVAIGVLLLHWQISPLANSLVEQIRERKRAEEQLSHMAHHDSLTGLPNRVLFHDRLRLAMIDADRRQQTVAAAFLDLDRFKLINDSLGHEAGDELLKQVAKRLAECLRAGDTVSRLGGDEFAMVLPSLANSSDIRQLAERLIGSFAQPFLIRGQELVVTVSMGITFYPTDATTAEGLLKNADAAMYRAKESGRNNYQFYSAPLQA